MYAGRKSIPGGGGGMEGRGMGNNEFSWSGLKNIQW